MGKYMLRRKSKTSRQVEVPGVLTRSKTLALASHIHLRTRRLLKPTNPPSLYSSTFKPLSLHKHEHIQTKDAVNLGVLGDDDAEEGENTLEIEGKAGRTPRETTPCSLIRDPNTIKTPGSSTKSTRPIETKHTVLNTIPKPIPSTSEVEEFFIGPEKQQQRLFIEKYNFDPVNDKPLHGRYEWVKLDATKKS